MIDQTPQGDQAQAQAGDQMMMNMGQQNPMEGQPALAERQRVSMSLLGRSHRMVHRLEGQAQGPMMIHVGQQNVMMRPAGPVTMERYPGPGMWRSRGMIHQQGVAGVGLGAGPMMMQGQTAMGQPSTRTPGMGYEEGPRLRRSKAVTGRKWPWDGHYEFNATQEEMTGSQYIWPQHPGLVPRLPKPDFPIDWNQLESDYDRSFLYSKTQIILIMGMSVTGTWTLRLGRSVLRAWPSS